MSPTPLYQSNGSSTGLTQTVTLPTYLLSDYLVLITNSNNVPNLTFSEGVVATELANYGSRLRAFRIMPVDDMQTSFTITLSVNAVLTWWIGSFRGIDLHADVGAASSNLGNSTSSEIAVSSIGLDYITTGDEILISASGVNASAAWTANPGTVFNTIGGNAQIMVDSVAVNKEHVAVRPQVMDRGLDGQQRSQGSIALVLQPIGNDPVHNILVNGSFESAHGSGVASGWEQEGNITGSATYSLSTDYATDALYTQHVQYIGQSGDNGQMFAFYQAPISAHPGDTLTVSIDAAGSKANCNLIVGIEDFKTGGVYISETDTHIHDLTETPTTYTVTHTCQEETDYIAVYIQFNEIYASTSVDAYFDRAFLVLEDGETGSIKTWSGNEWIDKPVKVWDGTNWVQRQVRVYNGTEWV